MRTFFLKKCEQTEPNSMKGTKEVTPRMQVGLKFESQYMLLPATRPGKKSHLIISLYAEGRTIGHCPWKQGALLLFSFSVLAGKTTCSSFHRGVLDFTFCSQSDDLPNRMLSVHLGVAVHKLGSSSLVSGERLMCHCPSDNGIWQLLVQFQSQY